MVKGRKVIGTKEYLTEAWVIPKNGFYKFGLQATPTSGRAYSFSVRLTEVFIEDFIDNNKNKEYLERVALRVIETYLEDILTLSRYSVKQNLERWFKEAKMQLDKENKKANDYG